MSKTLYNAAMDKITMSEQCENSILEAAANTVPAAEKRRRIRFIPVLAAAAILITGTVTAAAADGFDWIKGFFYNKNFEITNEVSDLMGEISDFRYESNCGIKFSPMGMISDENNLYCMFHADKMPFGMSIEELQVRQFYTGKTTGETEDDYFYDFGNSTTMTCETKDDAFILKLHSPDKKIFSSGDNITIRFDAVNRDSMERTGDYIKVNFNINNIDRIKNLDIVSNEPVTVDNVTFNNIHVTPLRIFASVTTDGNSFPFAGCDNPEELHIKIVMKDNVTISETGCCTWSSSENGYDIDWENIEPIDPENIAKFYIRNVCLYDCNNTIMPPATNQNL